MWLGSSQQLQRLNIPHVDILTTRVDVVDTARDLGVIIDSQLSPFITLSSICCVEPLTLLSAATTFISCRLDYCNSLLYGISDTLLQRLQSVQNAAALLVTGTRLCDQLIIIITPVLRQLHWLPVRTPPANAFQDCQLFSKH